MTKFRDLLHAKAFIARGLELHIITEDQVDQVMECDLMDGLISAKSETLACIWEDSGIAGKMLERIYLGLEKPITSPTTPLPIVKPCHRCGESHDEATPPRYCVRIMELEQALEKERLKFKPDYSAIDCLNESIQERDRRIAELQDHAEKEKVWYIEQVRDLEERLAIYKSKTFARFNNEE